MERENGNQENEEYLTSFTLCCSLLHKKVPNRQLYR